MFTVFCFNAQKFNLSIFALLLTHLKTILVILTNFNNLFCNLFEINTYLCNTEIN